MQRIQLMRLLPLLALLTCSAAEQPTIFESVEIVAIGPHYEAPIEIERDLLLQQFHKKIVLGLPLAYRFSRLVGRWQNASTDAESGRIEAPPVLVTAQANNGARFELSADRRTGVVELGGRVVKDEVVRHEILTYVREIVGEL